MFKVFRKQSNQNALSVLSEQVNSAESGEDAALSDSAGYDEWLQGFIRNRVLLTLQIWLITNSLYVFTAPFAHPEQYGTLFLIHGAIFLGLLAGWILYKSLIGNRYLDLLIVGAIWPVSLGDAQGTAFLDETDYCMYMTLTLLAAAILIPVRWRTHVVAQVGTLVYFLGVQAALGWTAASRNELYDQIMILCSVSGVASYSVYSYSRLQLAEFNVRRELEAANTKLHSLNHQLQEANLELQSLASLDSLTQIANRRYFDEYFNLEWQRLAREKVPLSLILCDVDFFKTYNDTYGHQAGDDCLQQVAKAIKSALKRSADLVARYGGEEFAIILPNTETSGAVHVAEKILAAVEAMEIAHANSQIGNKVTLSLGVASTVPGHKSSPATLIAAADRALYQAKAQGRARVILDRSNLT